MSVNSQHDKQYRYRRLRGCASHVISAILLYLLPQISFSSYEKGGWIGDWSAEIRPEGCSLETRFRDITAEADPNIDPRTYITNDPFRLYFLLSEQAFLGTSGEIPPGTLFLWLQPQVWDSTAEYQRDIVGVSIGPQFELHRPAAQPELQFFYLAGTSANSVYDDLIADRSVELVIETEQGDVFRREIPLPNGTKLRFRTLSRMLEACHQDRNP